MSRIDRPTSPKSQALLPRTAEPASSPSTQKPKPLPALSKRGWAPKTTNPVRTAPPRGDGFVDTRSLNGPPQTLRNELEELAKSVVAKLQENRDGSQTRSIESEGSEKKLTNKDGPLGASQTAYESTTSYGDRESKTSYESQTDAFGRTESTHSSQTTDTNGDQATSSEFSQSTGALGQSKTTQTQATTGTTGPVARTSSSSTTTDGYGNRSSTTEESVAREKASGARTTTTTSGTTTTKGSELDTKNTAEYQDGTYSVGSSADWNKGKSSEASWSKEQVRRPLDDGFSQKADDKLSRAQTVGDLLSSQTKTTLAGNSYDHVTENPAYKDANTFVGSRVGTRGEQSLSVSSGGVEGSYSREAVAGLYAEKSGSTEGSLGSASYDAKAKLEAKATVDANGKLDSNGLVVSAGAKAGVSAEASVHGEAKTKSVNVAGVPVSAGVEGNVKVSAEASAEATGEVQVTRNPPTAIAEGTVGVSAVAKAEADVKASVGPFAVKAGVYGDVGAEAKATGVIGFHDGKLELGGSVGAAFGIGAGANATVEVDVGQLGQMATNGAKEVATATVDEAKKVGGAAVDVAKNVGGAAVDTAKNVGGAAVDGAKKVASSAANKVKSFFGW